MRKSLSEGKQKKSAVNFCSAFEVHSEAVKHFCVEILRELEVLRLKNVKYQIHHRSLKHRELLL